MSSKENKVKINYIVNFYGGERRQHVKSKTSPLGLYLDKHIDFLSTNPKHVTGFTFIFNISDNPDEPKLIDETYERIKKLSIPGRITIRKNKGMSYEAWEEEIINSHRLYTHCFMIEDDYIPVQSDFLDYFLQKCVDDVSYVASYYATAKQSEIHAAVANGLLKTDSVYDIVVKNKSLFKLTRAEDVYKAASVDQIKFLDYIPGTRSDVADIAHTIYQHSFSEYYIFGDIDSPLIIKPIVR